MEPQTLDILGVSFTWAVRRLEGTTFPRPCVEYTLREVSPGREAIWVTSLGKPAEERSQGQEAQALLGKVAKRILSVRLNGNRKI